jgi:pyroglutamyl-peptidase
MSIFTRLCTAVGGLFQRDHAAAAPEPARERQMKRCHVTGFEPFGGASFNPSGALMKLLPEKLEMRKTEISIDTLVLPVCANDAMEALRSQFARNEANVVVLIGLAQGRKVLSLEERALNSRHYTIPDNCGNQWQNQEVEPEGPTYRMTCLPVQQIKTRLASKGFPCEVSQSAGTFVCNDLYFQALSELHAEHTRILFVHVPMLEDFAAAVSSNSALHNVDLADRQQQLKLMSEAILEVLEACFELVD